MDSEKETESELDGLLDRYDKELAKRSEQREAAGQEQEAFLEEFKRIKTDMIRPVMQRIGDKLKERGHRCQIFEEEESADYQGKINNAKITMKIVPAGNERTSLLSPDASSVSFIANKYTKKIRAHTYISMVNGGGHGGSAGEIDLNGLTSMMVERLIADVLKGMFESKWGSVKLH